MKVNQVDEKIEWDLEKANNLIFAESEEELDNHDLWEEEIMDQTEDRKKRKKIMKLKMRLKKLQGADKDATKNSEKEKENGIAKKRKKQVGDYRKEFYIERVKQNFYPFL